MEALWFTYRPIEVSDMFHALWSPQGKSRKLRSRQLQDAVIHACTEHRQTQQELSSVQTAADSAVETYLSFEHLAPLAEARKESLKEVDEPRV